MSERKLKPIVENFNVDEEFTYNKHYLFIKGYATGRNFKYTMKALPLARKIHNGQYRKGTVLMDGKEVQLPYLLHCLKVCSTLMSLNLPMTDEELDILYAAALLHDTIEDGEKYISESGSEFTNKYDFPEELCHIVKLLSKHSGANEYELNEYFNHIKKNKFALLIKMADRSHNVEDLYNKNLDKIHEYVKETREYIYTLGTYAKANYPELSNGITILKSKIVSLTELTETLVDLYQDKLDEKDLEIKRLNEEVEKLKKY